MVVVLELAGSRPRTSRGWSTQFAELVEESLTRRRRRPRDRPARAGRLSGRRRGRREEFRELTERDLLERAPTDAARGARLAPRGRRDSRRTPSRTTRSSWSTSRSDSSRRGCRRGCAPRGDPAGARHAARHRSEDDHDATTRGSASTTGSATGWTGWCRPPIGRRRADAAPSGHREDVRREARSDRRARRAAPPARPTGPSAAGRRRRRGRARGACATRGGDSSHTRTSPSRAVAGVSRPEPSTMSGSEGSTACASAVRRRVPVPALPDADQPARVGARICSRAELDAVVEAVPARVERVERDELHPPAERPPGDERARQGWSCRHRCGRR